MPHPAVETALQGPSPRDNEVAATTPKGKSKIPDKADKDANLRTRSSIIGGHDQDVVVEDPHWLIDSPGFECVIGIVIMVNAIQMGCSVQFPDSPYKEVWGTMEHFFTGIFVLEVAIKGAVLQREYFSDSWNIMDFCLAIVAVVDNWVLPMAVTDKQSSKVAVLRLFRLTRILRMVKMLRLNPEMIVLLHGILASLKATFSIGLLLCLVIYAFSLVCLEMIGKNGIQSAEGSELDVDHYFGNLPRAWLTLFNVCILTEWPEIVWPLSESSPWLVVVLGAFVIFNSCGLMNVIIGVLMERTERAMSKMREEEIQERKEFQMAKVRQVCQIVADEQANRNSVAGTETLNWSSHDSHDSPKAAGFGRSRAQALSLETLDETVISIESLENGDFQQLFIDIGLPRNFTSNELVMLLDSDGSGSVTLHEFAISMFRLIFSDDFQNLTAAQLMRNQIRVDVLRFQKEMRTFRDVTGKVLKDVTAKLNHIEEAVSSGKYHDSKGLPCSEVASVVAMDPPDSVKVMDHPLQARGILKPPKSEAPSEAKEARPVKEDHQVWLKVSNRCEEPKDSGRCEELEKQDQDRNRRFREIVDACQKCDTNGLAKIKNCFGDVEICDCCKEAAPPLLLGSGVEEKFKEPLQLLAAPRSTATSFSAPPWAADGRPIAPVSAAPLAFSPPPPSFSPPPPSGGPSWRRASPPPSGAMFPTVSLLGLDIPQSDVREEIFGAIPGRDPHPDAGITEGRIRYPGVLPRRHPHASPLMRRRGTGCNASSTSSGSGGTGSSSNLTTPSLGDTSLRYKIPPLVFPRVEPPDPATLPRLVGPAVSPEPRPTTPVQSNGYTGAIMTTPRSQTGNQQTTL